MATVQKLKEYLNNLNLNENLYIGYSDDDECSCEIFTEEDVIERANEVGGADDEDTDDRITDIDSALVYLADMNPEYHYMELEV
jgi:hypothetical protein